MQRSTTQRAGLPRPLASCRWLPLLLLVACGGIPRRTFEIQTIDPNERPLACLVVVNQDWEAAQRDMLVTNFGGKESVRVDVSFQRPEVDITVVPVAIDPTKGEIASWPKTRADAFEHQSEARFVRANDPPVQLFILDRR